MPLKKSYPWNVLVFPAASEVGLEISRALGDSKEVVLHGANQANAGVASFYFRNLYELPSVSDPTCLDRLQELIHCHHIDAIFPAHDEVLLWTSERAERIDAHIMTAPAPLARIYCSKRATYRALGETVHVPREWSLHASDMSFPVFVKPDRGQGSHRARRIDDRATLEGALGSEPDLLVMEYLPGREYTVDCFSQEKLLFVGARERRQSKMGIATHTEPVELPETQDIAEKIFQKLGLRGAWFFQLKEDQNNKLCVLEVSPRIAGSMAVSRISGPNFPLLALYDAAGYNVAVDTFQSKIPMGRSLDIRFIYDRPIEALYIDLDDTLIMRGEVNPTMIALVFQCLNRKIPVHLLTHHTGDLRTTLSRHRLGHLFDTVIHLPEAATPKADFIAGTDVVVIDDSFAERHAIKQRHGENVRCFDAAGAICLLDYRR